MAGGSTNGENGNYEVGDCYMRSLSIYVVKEITDSKSPIINYGRYEDSGGGYSKRMADDFCALDFFKRKPLKYIGKKDTCGYNLKK